MVLLELFDGKLLDAGKDKRSLAKIEELKERLSDKPIPKLLKAMLETDPDRRASASEAFWRSKVAHA